MDIFYPISFSVELLIVFVGLIILLAIFNNFLVANNSINTSNLISVFTTNNTDIVFVVNEYNKYSLNKYNEYFSFYPNIISNLNESISTCKISKDLINPKDFLLSKSVINVSNIFHLEASGIMKYYLKIFASHSSYKVGKKLLSGFDDDYSAFCLYIKDLKPIIFSDGIKSLSNSFDSISMYLDDYTINLQALDRIFPYLNDYNIDELVMKRKVEIGRLTEYHSKFANHIYNKTSEFLNIFNIALNEHSILTAEYLNALNLYFVLKSLKSKKKLDYNTKISFAFSQENGSGMFMKKDAEVRQNCEVIKQCHYFLIRQGDLSVLHPINLRKIKISQLINTYDFDNTGPIVYNNLIIKESPLLKEYDDNYFKIIQRGKIEFKN